MRNKKRDNWRELAQACVESGLSVQAWAQANGIPPTTCRQWLKRLRDETRPAENGQQGLSVWGKVEISEVTEASLVPFPIDNTPTLKLRYGAWSLEIKQGFDPVLLKQVIKAVEAQC